jgi:hypothetical protein
VGRALVTVIGIAVLVVVGFTAVGVLTVVTS